MDLLNRSIIDDQREVYGDDETGPPMLPHGDDPKAIPNRNAKRTHRKKSTKDRTAFITKVPKEKALPASDLPSGFPPELAFRALAAYTTIRTLSIDLRLSPFTPNVFLRALYLPFPNRLIGKIHMHILRILLCHLQMGYHWKEGSTPLNVSKKRKRDGIRWPLRGGDNLRFMDTYTWPVFYDDYCHLTADVLYASMHDSTDYVDYRTLDTSHLHDKLSPLYRKRPRVNKNQLSVLYLDPDDDSDEEIEVDDDLYKAEDIEDDDDEFLLEERPKKKQKRKKKSNQPVVQQPAVPQHAAHYYQYGMPHNNYRFTEQQLIMMELERRRNYAMQFQSQHPAYQRGNGIQGQTYNNNSAAASSWSNRMMLNNMMQNHVLRAQAFRNNLMASANFSPIQRQRAETAAAVSNPSHASPMSTMTNTGFPAVPFSPSRTGMAYPTSAHLAINNYNTNATNTPIAASRQQEIITNAWSSLFSSAAKGSSDVTNSSPATAAAAVATSSQQQQIQKNNKNIPAPPMSPPTVDNEDDNDSSTPPSSPEVSPLAKLLTTPSSTASRKGLIHGSVDVVRSPRPRVHSRPKSKQKSLFTQDTTGKETADTKNSECQPVSKLMTQSVHPLNNDNRSKDVTEYTQTLSTNLTGKERKSDEDNAISGQIINGKKPPDDHTKSPMNSAPNNIHTSGQPNVNDEEGNKQKSSVARANVNNVNNSLPINNIDITAGKTDHMESIEKDPKVSDSVAAKILLDPEKISDSTHLHNNCYNTQIVTDNARTDTTNRTDAILKADQNKDKVYSTSVRVGDNNRSDNATRLQIANDSIVIPQKSTVGKAGPNNVNDPHPLHVDHPTKKAEITESSDNKPNDVNSGISQMSLDPKNTSDVFISRNNCNIKQVSIDDTRTVFSSAAESSLKEGRQINEHQTTSVQMEYNNKSDNSATQMQLAKNIISAPSSQITKSNDVSTAEIACTNEVNGSQPMQVEHTKGKAQTTESCDKIIQNDGTRISNVLSDVEQNVSHSIRSNGSPSHFSLNKKDVDGKTASVRQVDEPLTTKKLVDPEDKQKNTHDSAKGVIDNINGSGEIPVCDGALTTVDENGDVPKDDKESVASSCDDSSLDDEDDEIEFWPQFIPLKQMRNGRPYHQLSLQDKITILEFLLDELLSIDSIAAEFSARHAITSRHQSPYGLLPTKEELEEIVNEDECAVCRLEGELLCCDGCTSSFHRKCMHMPEKEPLPEGEWLCTECRIKDPAVFGPLGGGRKSALEWFTQMDLDTAPSSQSQSLVSNTANTADHSDHNNALVLSSDEGLKQKVDSDNELLVIFGFVFRRKISDGDSSKIELFKDSELQNQLVSLGPNTCSMWPLAQIPHRTSIIFPNQTSPDKFDFFQALERFDPSFYDNRYRCAPLPRLVRRVTDANLMEYEVCCSTAVTKNLSAILTSNTMNDKAIADSLLTGDMHFCPFQMVSSYLLKLEADFSKASLLDENWKTKQTHGESHAWSSKVHNCRSVIHLAKSLLQLVDSTHHRAFDHSWFHCATLRSKETEDSAEHQRKMPLSKDFKASEESLRRHWERSPMSSMPYLVSRDAMGLDAWIHSIRPDLGPLGRRQKKRKKAPGKAENYVNVNAVPQPNNAMKSNDTPLNRDGQQKSDGGNSETKKSLSDGPTSRLASEIAPTQEEPSVVDNLRNRRRAEESESLSTGTNLRPAFKSSDDMSQRLHAQKRQRIAEVLEEAKTPNIPEPRWPYCGRKLFDPIGYLPPKAARHLGRRAGGVASGFVTYSSAYEVGQVSCYHIWRKRVKFCRSLEELKLLIRILQAVVDDGVVKKCISLCHRIKSSKGKPTAEVLWTQKDLRSGIDYHLVGEPGKGLARWVSSIDIDLSLLVHDRYRRRKARQKFFVDRLQSKLQQKRLAANATKKSKQETKNATKNSKQETKNAKLSQSDPNGMLNKGPDPALVSRAKKLIAEAAAAPKQQDVGMDAALASHKEQILGLCKKYGIVESPVSKVESIRKKTKAKLSKSYKSRGINLTEQQISSQIQKVEIDVLNAFAKSQQTLSSTDQNSQPSQSKPTLNDFVREINNSPDMKSILDNFKNSYRFLKNRFGGKQSIPSLRLDELRNLAKKQLVPALLGKGFELEPNQITLLLQSVEEEFCVQSTPNTNSDARGNIAQGLSMAREATVVKSYGVSGISSTTSRPEQNNIQRQLPINSKQQQFNDGRNFLDAHQLPHGNSQSRTEVCQTNYGNNAFTNLSQSERQNNLVNKTVYDSRQLTQDQNRNTPTIIVEQLISEYKEHTRKLIQQFGIPYPSIAIESIRSYFLKKLNHELLNAGINLSQDQLLQFLRSAELSAANEETISNRSSPVQGGQVSNQQYVPYAANLNQNFSSQQPSHHPQLVTQNGSYITNQMQPQPPVHSQNAFLQQQQQFQTYQHSQQQMSDQATFNALLQFTGQSGNVSAFPNHQDTSRASMPPQHFGYNLQQASFPNNFANNSIQSGQAQAMSGGPVYQYAYSQNAIQQQNFQQGYAGNSNGSSHEQHQMDQSSRSGNNSQMGSYSNQSQERYY